MKSKRMTGDDYLKELNEIDRAKASLKAHTKKRLKELIERFPNAVVLDNGTDNFLCEDIKEAWLDTMSNHETIRYIQNIEKWIAGIEKLRQMTIDEIYNEIPDELKKTLGNLND